MAAVITIAYGRQAPEAIASIVNGQAGQCAAAIGRTNMAGLCGQNKPACGMGNEWAATPEQVLLCRSCIGPRLPGVTADICPKLPPPDPR